MNEQIQWQSQKYTAEYKGLALYAYPILDHWAWAVFDGDPQVAGGKSPNEYAAKFMAAQAAKAYKSDQEVEA